MKKSEISNAPPVCIKFYIQPSLSLVIFPYVPHLVFQPPPRPPGNYCTVPNRSKTSFAGKTKPWCTPSFTVTATHYAIVESSSSTLLFFLICFHSPSNFALASKFRLQQRKRLMVSHRFYYRRTRQIYGILSRYH